MKSVKEIKSAIAKLSLEEQQSLCNWLNKVIITEQKRRRDIDEILDEVLREPRSRISLSEIVLKSRR
jgi:hypothetical protein